MLFLLKKCFQLPGSLQKTARHFLLMWSCVGTRIIRDMTLHSAPSFGSFHLLHLMFDEYVMYTIENLHNQEKSEELLKAAKGEISSDFLDEIVNTKSTRRSSGLGEIFTDVTEMDTTTANVAESNLFQNVSSGSTVSNISPTSYQQSDTRPFQQNLAKTNGGAMPNAYPVFNNASIQTTSYNTSNMSGQQPLCPEFVTYTTPEMNNIDSYDWLSASHSYTNMASDRNSYHLNYPFKANQSGIGQTCSFQCTDLEFKRQASGSHFMNKKYPDSSPAVNKSNMADTYNYPSTNLI